ncbi:hypothetical protein KC355_g604 [Hortaea werneckii]|nr:hypothetical protein KC355_g604 [Hortaea werneckii]
MFHQSNASAGSGRVQRPARSKTGCLTCRRRKVRCNEQRPRCGHCERLNLQCLWRPVQVNRDSSQTSANPAAIAPSSSLPSSQAFDFGAENVFDGWDFNSAIWQDTSAGDPTFLDWFAGTEPIDPAQVDPTNPAALANVQSLNLRPCTPPNYHTQARVNDVQSGAETASPASSADLGGHALVEHFLASVVPPILAAIEVGPRWTSTKMLFASLCAKSPMVRHSIMAFSALEVSSDRSLVNSEHRLHYQKASMELSSFLAKEDSGTTEASNSSRLQPPLAAVFFLSYCDLLTNRVSEAQALLRDASVIVRNHKGQALTSIERRLISWIRLVDARTSSAGGDGTFLAATEDAALTPDKTGQDSAPNHTSIRVGVDAEIEEILFDILYTPGIVFYQGVQSIMARVSNIDPWHRSRGTVEDETEVMSVAAGILKDLKTLETQRPALMDHAVAGSLTERHLAPDIAVAITRSYRTYWANYESSFIHLHRVAHKHLPPTADVLRARSTIKRIARLLEEAREPLPVNFIWPLLMACCEEDNLEERASMIRSIRGMQSVASNARPIADVLEEVHRRQDSTKQRADVRQTSMDLFNMSFAVV